MNRRTYLVRTGSVAAVAAGFAGCLGDAGSTDGDVWTSFFVLQEITTGVAGEQLTVENVVPAGQHGHGWEPSAAVQRDVLGGDAFIYMGEGFQPWADDVVHSIREEDSDVRIVEARHGVELLPPPGDHDDHEGDGHDNDGHDDEGDGHDDKGDDHDDDSHDEGDDHDDELDHGDHDPHFWLDPVRLEHAVENVREGLADVDPDAAETFESNAESYVSELSDLHETFDSRLADRDKGAVLVAGHNAFQYLANRYEFEVHALSGIAPDAKPSPQDVTRAQEVIEHHDLEYVLAPALESQKAATQLVEETDASEVLPLTSMAGRTEAWRENDWGYFELMREVNLASLEQALGAR